MGASQALETGDIFITRHVKRAILVSRLLPFISFDSVSYGAGLTPIRLGSLWLRRVNEDNCRRTQIANLSHNKHDALKP
jgi:hypothetical protein